MTHWPAHTLARAAAAWITAFVMASAAPAGSETQTAMEAPVILVAFGPDAPAAWFVVNDGVMGGVSQGGLRRTDAGTGVFAGTLSLENNGGFASVRTVVSPGDLSAWTGLELRVRGDGRTYQLRLRTDDGFDGVAYRAEFPTLEGAWATVRLPFTDFLPSFRGRILRGVPALDTAGIRQVGLMLADKRAGPFSLEVEFVRTYAGEAGARN